MPWERGELRNPSAPEKGVYALKLVKKGPEVGAMITQTPTEEGLIWQALINGELAPDSNLDPQLAPGVLQVWLHGRRIDHAEYDFLLARYRWHKENAPHHPFARPYEPVNRRSMKPIGG